MNDASRERIRELEEKHRHLDQTLARLERRAYLTPGEQHEVTRLKKEKLLAKDRLFSLLRS